jgi:uncharacterized membrane protein YhaH (DUF805 family)
MNWYLLVFKKYATFSGRSRRMEYWMFVLFNLIVSIIIGIIDTVLGLNIISSAGRTNGIIGSLYSLTTMVPSLAVGVRRLHDINKSGWFLLLPFAPLILILIGALLGGYAFILMIAGGLGAFILSIVLIVWLATEGTAGENQYGPDPKSSEGFSSNELLDN